LASLVFRPPPISDVVQCTDLSEHATVGTARRLRDVVNVTQRTVRMNDPILDIHRLGAHLQLIA
jgi:hypothetical protein